jgi:LuxR family maltose regulon positive regulatory protein
MAETITAAASPALDHIIERPRLIARLAEGGGARVSVLAAPAGYGKTTLARQWSERQPGPVAWYRTTRASGDVALLAVQLDDLLASLAPEFPREPQQVAAIASVNPSPQPLGRAILRTFDSLSRDVLLVVDEWEAAGTEEAEELLSMLVEGLDIRFLITTRTRPEWFTPRLEVYGEGLEIGVEELTMTDAEAARVLNPVGAVAGRARLMRTAEGWPAVLGLAAMSGDVDFTSSRLLSRTLYDFLASELLAAAAPETQAALMLLAVASITEVEVARSVLEAGADRVIQDAAARGLVAITDQNSLSLHPLLRELLIRRFEDAEPEARETQLLQARKLFELRRWDEALSVSEVARDAAFATEAIKAALDDLLAAGRTSSLQRWVAAARAAGASGGLIDYAESEALLRANKLEQSLALATQAAGSLAGDLAARAHLVAGTSAHLTDRPDRTQRHADLAAASAETAQTHEGALWLRVLGAQVRQSPDLRERLAAFRKSAESGPKQSLMIATAELLVAEYEGGVEDALEDARAVLRLAGSDGANPIAHTGCLSTFSALLVMRGQYEEGLASSEKLASIAENSGLEFAAPYAQHYSASANIGLRRFTTAARMLSALERDTQGASGSFFSQNLPSQRARLYGSVGDLERALDVLSLDRLERNGQGSRGEFIGWRALFTAITGDSHGARALAEDARRVSRDLGTSALSHIAETVIALTAGNQKAAIACLRSAVDTGMWDPLVVAIRAAPHLGAFIADQPQWRSLVQQLLVASRDVSLAASLGLRIPRAAKARGALSPRESEVHELVAQGLTNEEIARLLYISVSTTKVHVKHIYEKLGVRSRLEAARALRDDI